MRLDEKYKTLLNKSGINTPLRTAHFMAQIEHESGLKPIQENLNYSMDGLWKTFPKYFPSVTDRNKHARNPMAIANKVYANRMGNGSENSGDGYKYRGRGFIQLTGKNNYQNFNDYSGIDVIKNPDLLLDEANAMLCAILFWNENHISQYADKDDLDAVSDAINLGRQTEREGDSNGYAHRKECLIKWKLILNI